MSDAHERGRTARGPPSASVVRLRRCAVASGGRMRLKGKTALVTGSSRGIGREIAVRFAREGADVAVNYNGSAEAAEAVAAAIRAEGRRAVVVQADVGRTGE